MPSPTKSSSGSSTGYATDVFGSVIQTSTGVPALKKQPECTCPNCNRNMAATRYGEVDVHEQGDHGGFALPFVDSCVLV